MCPEIIAYLNQDISEMCCHIFVAKMAEGTKRVDGYKKPGNNSMERLRGYMDN